MPWLGSEIPHASRAAFTFGSWSPGCPPPAGGVKSPPVGGAPEGAPVGAPEGIPPEGIPPDGAAFVMPAALRQAWILAN